jgi:hypothetical protein
LSGNSITEALKGRYNITFEEAETNKIECQLENQQNDEDLQNSIMDFGEPICSEIERLIDYVHSTFVVKIASTFFFPAVRQ